MGRIDKPDENRKTGAGGSHEMTNAVPSEVALQLALKRRAEARERDRNDPQPSGKRYRKFGKR